MSAGKLVYFRNHIYIWYKYRIEALKLHHGLDQLYLRKILLILWCLTTYNQLWIHVELQIQCIRSTAWLPPYHGLWTPSGPFVAVCSRWYKKMWDITSICGVQPALNECADSRAACCSDVSSILHTEDCHGLLRTAAAMLYGIKLFEPMRWYTRSL